MNQTQERHKVTKYHINPETGNPNVCAAKVKCKLTSENGVTPPHYETKEAAIKAMEALTNKKTKPKSDSSKAAPKKPVTPKNEKPAEAETASSAVEKVQEVAETSVARVATVLDDELRGSERLEKAIKAARKASIELELRKKTLATKIRRLRDKAWDSQLSKHVLKKRA
jgi:LmbE family N-acetylglucosaminyl deacetylase